MAKQPRTQTSSLLYWIYYLSAEDWSELLINWKTLLLCTIVIMCIFCKLQQITSNVFAAWQLKLHSLNGLPTLAAGINFSLFSTQGVLTGDQLVVGLILKIPKQDKLRCLQKYCEMVACVEKCRFKNFGCTIDHCYGESALNLQP